MARTLFLDFSKRGQKKKPPFPAEILQVFVYCLLELLNRLCVPVLNGVGDAVRDMLVYYFLAQSVQCRAYRRNLNNHIGTVVIVFNHRFYMIKVTAHLCKAVELSLLLLGIVMMAEVAVLFFVFVIMFVHGNILKSIYYIIQDFFQKSTPPGA